MRDLLTELKRRNVFRVAVFYIVAAWLIIQVADILLEALSIPDWGMRLILVILLLGFPIALAFSWIFELTPEGLKLEKDVDRSASITGETGRKLDIATIVVVLAVAGLVVWQQFSGPPQVTPGPDASTPVVQQPAPEPADSGGSEFITLAVLPFRNFSSDEENEYFVDGLSEELMNILAGIDQLRVAARTSSFSFKGKDIKVQEIGRELNVAHVLEGSVRKSGNKIRVTAQLIQVSDGYHLWSENFDRELDDIFAIQDEIASRVAEALRVELLGEDEAGTTDNALAYDRYLSGRFHLRQLAAGGAQRAADEFQAAIDLDPSFAAAWAGLADAFAALIEFGGMPEEEARQQQRKAVEKAESLNPDLPEVLVARAQLLLSQYQNLKAQGLLERAIEAKPNDIDTLELAGLIANSLGEHRRHDELLAQMMALDPLSVEIRAHAAVSDLNRGDFDAAWQRIEGLESAHPNDPVVHDYSFVVAYRSGEWAKANRYLERLQELRPMDVFAHRLLAINWLYLGRRDYYQRWLEVARERAPGSRYVLLAEDSAFVFDDRWEERKKFWQARMEGQEFNVDVAYRVATSMMRLGELEEAATLFERSLESMGYSRDAPVYFGIDGEVRHLAWLYQKLGRDEDAQVLIDQLSALYEKSWAQARPMCLRARSFAELDKLRGDLDAAYAKLEYVVANGCITTRYPQRSLYFADVMGSPEFQAIFAGNDALVEEQRELAEREGWGVPPEV